MQSKWLSVSKAQSTAKREPVRQQYLHGVASPPAGTSSVFTIR